MIKQVIYFTAILSALILFQHCTSKNDKYNADACLTKEKQNVILQAMVRYANKLAPEATHETKFNSEFNWYYDKAVLESRILFCSLNQKDSVYEVLVARQARSITPMEEGIGLRVKFGQKNGLALYDEVFRMWKMPADTLRIRGEFLFERMVKQEDLTLYYSKFQQDRYIEFPDDRFRFNKETRRWSDAELDSIQF